MFSRNKCLPNARIDGNIAVISVVAVFDSQIRDIGARPNSSLHLTRTIKRRKLPTAAAVPALADNVLSVSALTDLPILHSTPFYPFFSSTRALALSRTKCPLIKGRMMRTFDLHYLGWRRFESVSFDLKVQWVIFWVIFPEFLSRNL